MSIGDAGAGETPGPATGPNPGGIGATGSGKLILAAVLTLATPAAGADSDLLYQVSTIDALLAGLYDGVAEVGQLTAHGDLGLGTFDRLDGELILLDGQVYRAAADGSVVSMPPDSRTPFMAVTEFSPDLSFPVPAGISYEAFKSWLEQRLPSRNLVYALRMEGRFRDIRYRSVPAQQPPYLPLSEVARQQRLFHQQDLSGTLLGFWCPRSVRGLNVPGLHLHLLSADRKHAGHLLDFELAQGEVQLDLTNGIQVELPLDPEFLHQNQDASSDSALHAVEQASGHR